MVNLAPLHNSDRDQFVRDNQEAFRYSATEEFGLRDAHFGEDGEIISRKTILASLEALGSQAYRILRDGSVVGGLILIVDEEAHKGSLDILFVDPAAHSQGIGQAAWAKVEALFPQINVWTTHTPYFEKRNIHFYVNRLGFKIVAYYNARFPDSEHRFAEDDDTCGMFKFEKRIR